MEKKTYIIPQTDVLTIYAKEATMLENWSAPDATGGGNRPDAKEAGFFEEESDCAYNPPSIEYNVWADEEEE